jgi:predicted transglutaminase-like cysteine proteinase
MKRILTAVAVLLISAATFAQSNDGPPPAGAQGGKARTPMTPEQRAKRETDRTNGLVALGDAYQKVLDVNTQTEIKKAKIMNGAKRSELTEDQKTQLAEVNKEHRKNLEAAMGKDLWEKLKAAEKAKREERKNANQPQGGAPKEETK